MKLKSILFALLAVIISACSNKPAEITCTEVDGNHKDAISVPEETFTLEADGEGDMQTLTLNVKMAAKEHISGITLLDEKNIKLNEMFGIAVCDENGAELTVLKLDSDAAKTAFINVLKGKAGETKEVKFSKKNVAKDKVKDVLKKAKTFKVKYLSVALENVNLSGNIGKYPVCMTLNIDENGVITGAYYYKRMGAKALLYMKGALEDGKIQVNEFNIQGDNTGTFDGTFKDDKFGGIFDTYGTRYAYDLKLDAEMNAIDVSSVPYDIFNTQFVSSNMESSDDDSSFSSDNGSVDWDEWLDQYERCVDKVISLNKKMKNNDPSAISEYTEYYEEMQKLSEKVESAKGDLSVAQLNRLNKILAKLAKNVN